MLCIIGVSDARQEGKKWCTILEWGYWWLNYCIHDGDHSAARPTWYFVCVCVCVTDRGRRRMERDKRRVALDLSCQICNEKPGGNSWFTIGLVTREEEENVRETRKSYRDRHCPTLILLRTTPVNPDIFQQCFLLLLSAAERFCNM